MDLFSRSNLYNCLLNDIKSFAGYHSVEKHSKKLLEQVSDVIVSNIINYSLTSKNLT